MPAKYKPAARRVTAIMVGIPLIIVLTWELWQRANGKPIRKFEDMQGKNLMKISDWQSDWDYWKDSRWAKQKAEAEAARKKKAEEEQQEAARRVEEQVPKPE